MVEIIALFIVCRNVGQITRSRGVAPRRYQARAVGRWFLYEFIAVFVAAILGIWGVLLYVIALGGAFASLPGSFKAAREAGMPQPDHPEPPEDYTPDTWPPPSAQARRDQVEEWW